MSKGARNMKINESCLSRYSSLRDGIDKEGFLNKKGEGNKAYQRRWFVLKGNLLFYYEKIGDKQPLGVIILENCNIDVSDNERYAFNVSFESSENTRTYVLAAESEKEMEHWMKCITSASYRYTKMVVKEFEKTLSRIKTNDMAMIGSAGGIPIEQLNQEAYNSQPYNAGTDKLDSSKTQRATTKSLTNKKLESSAFLSVTSSGHKFLGGIKKAKSVENLSKLQSVISKSPNMIRRKTKTAKTVAKIPVINAVVVDSDQEADLIVYDDERSLFEILHNSFGASIWTRVREFEQQSSIDGTMTIADSRFLSHSNRAVNNLCKSTETLIF